MDTKAPFVVVVDVNNPSRVVGFSWTAPLQIAFALLAASLAGNEPPFDMVIKTTAEMGLPSGAPSRPGAMDPALRARAVCPVVIDEKAGEVGAMLSILSEKIAGQGGR